MIVPSDDLPNGLSALGGAIGEGAHVRAAVAFVTRSGVDCLAEVLAGAHLATLEITVRAADATEPEALLALRDQLGADVSVVIGAHAQRFHPKLWLIERQDVVTVISGSGNLTRGGLLGNDEQFECLELQPDHAAVGGHHDRLDRLTRHAHGLAAIEGHTDRNECLAVRRRQASLRQQLAQLERDFMAREPMPDRSGHKAQLVEDLQRIYDETVAADLPQADGRQYHPNRLLVALRAAREGEREPVKVVSDTIRKRTDGLDILLEAGRVDLTLEWLVLDASKPYHDLYTPASVAMARARIEEFRTAGHSIPGHDAPRPTATPEPSDDTLSNLLTELIDGNPEGYPLPALHRAPAVLLRIDGAHAVVRRGSGSEARIPFRVIRLHLNQIAAGRRIAVSELNDESNNRFSAALGPQTTWTQDLDLYAWAGETTGLWRRGGARLRKRTRSSFRPGGAQLWGSGVKPSPVRPI